tara:strand:+ start:9971 stop:10102 length:132 start_codon:yes stop_codon:yes gene_type:complete
MAKPIKIEAHSKLDRERNLETILIKFIPSIYIETRRDYIKENL